MLSSLQSCYRTKSWQSGVLSTAATFLLTAVLTLQHQQLQEEVCGSRPLPQHSPVPLLRTLCACLCSAAQLLLEAGLWSFLSSSLVAAVEADTKPEPQHLRLAALAVILPSPAIRSRIRADVRWQLAASPLLAALRDSVEVADFELQYNSTATPAKLLDDWYRDRQQPLSPLPLPPRPTAGSADTG